MKDALKLLRRKMDFRTFYTYCVQRNSFKIQQITFTEVIQYITYYNSTSPMNKISNMYAQITPMRDIYEGHPCRKLLFYGTFLSRNDTNVVILFFQ